MSLTLEAMVARYSVLEIRSVKGVSTIVLVVTSYVTAAGTGVLFNVSVNAFMTVASSISSRNTALTSVVTSVVTLLLKGETVVIADGGAVPVSLFDEEQSQPG